MFDLPALREAATFVRQHVPPTAQHAWPLLAERLGCQVWVKHENHAPTGAFKVRGGLVYVRSRLASGKPPRGLVTATRGNHGQSMALAARQAGLPLVIVVPQGNSPEKNAAMRALGAELVEHGVDFDVAREEAARLAETLGYERVPSFHPELVRGVATYALELFEAVGELDCVYVPIGMGSGICGLIQARNLLGLRTQIVGVVSSAADAYAQSIEQGRIVTTATADTFADGMACRVPHPDAFALVQAHAARIVRVDDREIAAAMRLYHEATHNTAEGAGAAALAALIQERERQAGKRVAVVLSGANVDRERYARVLLGD
ncbi:threonine dehydratase [Pseudomonas guariconensis]|uniref:threonine dehydratase n=1 Tax=Pseudomonas TaxID=286 RepID=UPI001CE420CC|nr:MULTISPECIES: threonine dehydratase [Pseudomonas]MCO7637090.1 threonine dehydratase [Pseudomonas sp. S 311-6]MCO7515828.1 threonine dehydratase [Pseudomonas putida]MCO7566123.1 threonine dehydratase [Pseudomonas mosselii]MCO7595774.1 threonine dehydratase [Pseudomonas guariconensis]MCO7605828.1 threonine dehydratase [Pseudomonas guariconensis]